MARSSSQQTGVAELALPFSGFLPREAVAQSTDGACTLSDVELVGRILRDNGGVGAAYIILDEYSSVQAAVSASVGDFTHRTGLDASAHQDLQLAHELGLRMARAGLEEKCILNSWSGLMVYLKSRLAHAKTEQFRMLFLDNKNRLIADEVMAGFGRTGKWFGIDHFAVVPDLMTFAKGVTSGYVPLGGVLVGKRLAQALVEQGGDFFAGPISSHFTHLNTPLISSSP